MHCSQRQKQSYKAEGSRQVLCQVSVNYYWFNSCRKNLHASDIVMLNNEVDVYQALDHPNIVKFIECFEDEKVISIIMELMEEGNVSFQIFSLS